MSKEFLGYHSEWNLGSPGGWDYQRMAQEIGKFAWAAITKRSGVNIELDFDDPILNPVPNFAQTLLRFHRKHSSQEKPFIALVAEEETLEKVGENIRFVEYLNTLPDVKAALLNPSQLQLKDREIVINNEKVTTIFLDFNNNVIVKLKKQLDLNALLSAIDKGIVINPRGMEPIGAKGVFEVITSDRREKLSETTVARTPWTRQVYPRKTTGPDGQPIPDLVQWIKDNWDRIILKPVHGYSGKGIIIGHKEPNRERALKYVLDTGDYIVQPLIPLELWAEQFPWIDKEKKKVFLKSWQTDFRCFVTDAGLIGFVTRFGGIPTNVGSGGGVQSTAILRSDIPLQEAIRVVNQTILDLGFDYIWGLQRELDKKSVEIGNVYLLGPIMGTLRPRLITQGHIEQLKNYAKNLWYDALILEELWRKGCLDTFVQITQEEKSIAQRAPWQGKPALIAADGLFGFT
ncbi:MAG: hypothetical protein JSW40_01780 [Candidatus Omnitrophota bacterium]|nr:MAG: hypothetical protein JSW40_01780 [Candidatus Omnitrophota bacterium]